MDKQIDSVEDCLTFFQKGYPVSKDKNFRTQLGVFLEEIAETLDQVECADVADKMLLDYLTAAIEQAGNHIKAGDGLIKIKDRELFLDGLCDVLVTAVGVAYHGKMDIVGAFKEVNRSNNSKFDENGNPILDNNLKITKGPNYSKPDLKSFV